MVLSLAIDFQDVREAAQRLRGIVQRTPVIRSDALDQVAGCALFLKCENLGQIGAFKIRGAYNTMAQLDTADRRRGVVAFSSGNHAQGVALAAKLLGMRATIVMPADAPRVKLEATRRLGAEIVFYDRERDDREAIAARIREQTGATLVPPFDDPRIMAGQGTAALELMEDAPDLEILLVPLGGGGLLAGCATAAKALRPQIRVFGVEPEGANDWWLSWQAGQPVRIDAPRTIADGLLARMPGSLTWPVARAHADGVLLVSDDEIIAAMRLLAFDAHIIAEPSGAVALAAVLFRKIDASGKRIGVIISGGNINMEDFLRLVDR